MIQFKLIKSFESVIFTNQRQTKSNNDVAPKFSADIDFLLNNGWRLVSSGFEIKEINALSGWIYSWAYIENIKDKEGEAALRERGLL